MPSLVHFLKSGRISYTSGLKIQDKVCEWLKNGLKTGSSETDGIIILTEHNPVYTVGIRSSNYDMKLKKKLIDLGAEFFKTTRGGLITFHGPGQLIVYPVLNLKRFRPSVRWYVSELEKTVILVCKEFGISACTSPHTGVWVNNKKICAIGLRVSQYITSHGLALNCETDLNWFNHIIPCGIEGKGVTSLSAECGRRISVEDAIVTFLKCFSLQFNCNVYPCSEEIRQNLLESLKLI